MTGKVIGIGGIFFKFKDHKKMNSWYKEALGLESNDYGVLFKFNARIAPGYLQLGTFEETSDYFGKDSQQAMINFRVDDLEALLEKLKGMNVKIVDEIKSYDYGSFLHIEDPEGNRIELWEAKGSDFDKEKSVEML